MDKELLKIKQSVEKMNKRLASIIVPYLNHLNDLLGWCINQNFLVKKIVFGWNKKDRSEEVLKLERNELRWLISYLNKRYDL